MKPSQMIALAALLACSPADAQDAAQTASATAPCELRVWPTDTAKTCNTLMDLFDPRKGRGPTLANAISQFETVFAESVTGAMQAAGQAKSKGKKSK